MADRTIGGDEFHRRVRQGPQERDRVVGELFRLHYPEFVARLVYKGLPRQIAEERASEVFMGLLRNAANLSAATPPIHYLNRAVSNAICDYHAREGRKPSAVVGIPASASAPDLAAATRHDMPDRPPVVASLDDDATREVEDPSPMASPQYELERRQNCAVQAWRQFERDLPSESEWLAAYALDEMDMEEARAAMGARSAQAARQRMYTWRARLRELCREFCGTENCDSRAKQDGPHGG